MSTYNLTIKISSGEKTKTEYNILAYQLKVILDLFPELTWTWEETAAYRPAPSSLHEPEEE